METSFAHKLEKREESLKQEAKELAHVGLRIRKKLQVFAGYVCATSLSDIHLLLFADFVNGLRAGN